MVPNGGHGRLVHKGGMSDGNADKALNVLAGVALALSNLGSLEGSVYLVQRD